MPELSEARRYRKDASRSLNREGANRALVFEVKYFKYTLFVPILPPHRMPTALVVSVLENSDVGTAAFGGPSSEARLGLSVRIGGLRHYKSHSNLLISASSRTIVVYVSPNRT